jgi:hypothetical protein
MRRAKEHDATHAALYFFVMIFRFGGEKKRLLLSENAPATVTLPFWQLNHPYYAQQKV